ncbi:MAG: putative DNA-binding domain-containing protein [Methylibium sp.]|nr:putative DNA-binding domain-containing protein [Methylibium sp.]
MQQAFAAALLDPERTMPQGLIVWNGADPAPRFAVYRNNVVVSLVSALAGSFPVVRELVGEAFFSAMARIYVAQHPPRSPVLADYGDTFADWLRHFEPAGALPYLPDMARLERARARAYHAADEAPLAAHAMAARLADPQRLPAARLRLHPSASLFDSPFAVVSLWAAHQGGGHIEDVDLDEPEAALVLRHDDDATVLPVPLAAGRLFRLLIEGRPLGEAASAAMACDPAFDLAAALSLLIAHYAIVAWHPTGDDS